MLELLLLPLFAVLDMAAGGKFEKGRGGPLKELPGRTVYYTILIALFVGVVFYGFFVGLAIALAWFLFREPSPLLLGAELDWGSDRNWGYEFGRFALRYALPAILGIISVLLAQGQPGLILYVWPLALAIGVFAACGYALGNLRMYDADNPTEDTVMNYGEPIRGASFGLMLVSLL